MKYKPIAEVLSKLESTTKRLEMTKILTDFLKNVDKEDLEKVILLLMGTIFPEHSEETIGVADKLMIKVINKASGSDEKEITKMWKDTGDLGEVAEELMKERKQSTLSKDELTVKKVFNNLEKVSRAEGKGSVSDKVSLISELLTNAEPLEAKYLTRTVLGTLRVGVGRGTIRNAISETFNCDKKLVEKAYNLTADYSKVVSIAAGKGDKGLKKVGLDIGRPAKSMLYQKEESIKDGFERVGRPAAIQYKYDGLRMQVHKKNDEVKLYTRRLDEVTKMFPEVVKAVKQNVKQDCVLDAEGVGYHPKKKSYKPFQEISKRIKRKYDIEKLAEETPVVLYIFDILNYNGESCLGKPYKERLKILKKSVNEKKWSIELANQLITNEEGEAQEFYDEALKKDQEGVIMKNLEAPYKPGSRVGYGVKIKPIMEPLDLTITGATWGKGRRSNWLSSFVLSCKKEEGYLEIGKLGTGLSDEQFKEVTKKLKPLITKEEGKEVSVKPEIIIEVAYEEIQKSPTYSSGYALRFPRLIRFRPDKEEPDSLERVKKIYKEQSKK
ncbi:ATP-dependent DNA ligase [archaeon]|nr:ATP-dependent DNA ligase [archaeon]